LSLEGEEGSSSCDTGWKTVPCASSHHTEASVTDGAKLRSGNNQARREVPWPQTPKGWNEGSTLIPVLLPILAR